MSDLRSIAALYEQVDNHFDDLRDNFDEAGRERVEQEQRINDQAYFVLAWGQLEADVGDAAKGRFVTGNHTETGATGGRGASTIQESPA